MQRQGFDEVSRVVRPVYRVAEPEIKKYRVEPLEQPRRLQKSQKNYKVLSICLIVIILVMLVAGGWMIMSNKSSQKQTLTVVPQSVLDSVEFPLYYPAQLPKDFRTSSPPQAQNGIVTFNYIYQDDKQLIMTQQARPKLMEEVKKTKEITLPFGKSYIADLNGRTAGIVVTDKTLVIITSSTKTIDSDKLETFIRSLEKIQ